MATYKHNMIKIWLKIGRKEGRKEEREGCKHIVAMIKILIEKPSIHSSIHLINEKLLVIMFQTKSKSVFLSGIFIHVMVCSRALTAKYNQKAHGHQYNKENRTTSEQILTQHSLHSF